MNESSDSKFVTRNWNIANDQSNANYVVGKEIIFNTKVLESNLCDYNDVFILVRGNVTIAGNVAARVAFDNCGPFINCITKIDGTTIDDPEDLDLVIPMYNTLEYSSNYSNRTVSLWFSSKDEATNFNKAIADNDNY